MSFYNTGNPVPSIDPRDLDDNAKHIDELTNSTFPTFVDRLGTTRRTLAGIEQDNSLITSPTGSTLVGTTLPAQGAEPRTVAEKLYDVKHLKDFGAIGDNTLHPVSEWYTIGFAAYRGYANLAAVQVDYPHVTSGTDAIDWAAWQASQNYAVTSPSYIFADGMQLVVNKTTFWKGGAFNKGVPGHTMVTLAPGSNCTIFESDDFDYWAAWTSGSNAGYTIEGGIDGFILNGNGGAQTVVPTNAANMQYGLRVHSHRFGIGWLQVMRVNGVGMLTQYNSALMSSYRTDGIDDFGMFGDPRGTSSPYAFQQINVIDCLYEHFVFNGPADIPIWSLTTNYCGWLGGSPAPTTPRTSLLFPGEEIHSFRQETACKIGYLNLNNALYGRGLWVADFTRVGIDYVVGSGSWGNFLISGSAFGCISSMSIQHSSYAWGGVYHPGCEITAATGSAANRNRLSIPQASIRRFTTPVSPNAIGPAILDNSGAQFGIIDGVDSNAVAGHGLVIGSTNRGGVYESVNFDRLQGTAGDGTVSAGVVVQSGARDWRITELRLTDCAKGLVNLGTNMRGIVRDGTIEINQGGTTGQIALEGVVPLSQLASVTPGSGNIAIDNISSWGMEILDASTRYYNRFKATVSYDASISGAQGGTALPHTMWRQPDPRDVKIGWIFGGTTWPAFDGGIRSLAAGTYTPAIFVRTTGAGGLTGTVELG